MTDTPTLRCKSANSPASLPRPRSMPQRIGRDGPKSAALITELRAPVLVKESG